VAESAWCATPPDPDGGTLGFGAGVRAALTSGRTRGWAGGFGAGQAVALAEATVHGPRWQENGTAKQPGRSRSPAPRTGSGEIAGKKFF